MNIPQGINLYGNVIERGGFERLAAFPSTNNFAGRMVQLTTDGKYYKRNEANTGWDVFATDTDLADAKSRANHTGTQLANTISDFDTAVDARVALGTAGLYDDRGNYDASVGTFPTTGGSGAAGAIKKGDVFLVSVAGTLGSVGYSIGDSFRALVDTPGQTAGNWASMKQGSTISNAVIKSSPVQIGNGSLSVIGVTHNLNTKNIKAIVRKVSNDEIWTLEPAPTSVNACNLDFGAVLPTTNEFEVVIIAG